MLIAIDVGNTNIVIGAFDGTRISERWRIATDPQRMPDEYAALFDTLFRMAGLHSRITDVVIGSVVPSVQASLREMVTRFWNTDPLIVTPQLDLGIEVMYLPPQAVGADRVANAVAAVDLYSVPAIVVDFGTATTFDAISRDGTYVGGAIAPGIEVAQEALFSRTAQLPRVPLEPPPAAVGRSTVTSLQSGILFGYAGLVDGIVDRMRGELGEETVTIATGGLSTIIAPLTSTIQHVNADLTLIGLRILYQRNARYAGQPRLREA